MTHTHRYDFNAKEHQPELGLNWHDYHARNYDVALGRWMNVDPLGEGYASWSPYNYVMNSPLRFIDPTGMYVEDPPGTNCCDHNQGHRPIPIGEYSQGSSNNGIKESKVNQQRINGILKLIRGINIWGNSDGDQIKGHKGTTQGSFSTGDLPFSGPTGPKSSNIFMEFIRYTLGGLGLADKIPESNKTSEEIPKVSNNIDEANNVFYLQVHYSEKETGIPRGSKRHLNDLNSYEKTQMDSAGIIDGTTRYRLNSSLKIDSVGVRNIQLKKP